MTKIYEHNLTNVKYDRHLPVYINPANPHWYILITLEACQEWARALGPSEPKLISWRLIQARGVAAPTQ
ncbi:hypothetical protein VP01_1101g10 [Puccinia sorghi]|uniref:Uncharacterized protein n=1 Tax=Puccinia sorghi TaxID=27349 RepID=A0A0L6VT26_9BASI|nr:hypothetical protein VP01_1101g10 [Puccinia sorghi]